MVANYNFVQTLILTAIACNCVNKASANAHLHTNPNPNANANPNANPHVNLNVNAIVDTASAITRSGTHANSFGNSVNASRRRCTDNQQYTFKTTRHSNRTCEWINKDPLTRCTILDENQIPVRDRCRATCNNCPVDDILISQPHTTSNTISTLHHRRTNAYKNYNNYNNYNDKQKQKVGAYCLTDSDCYSWSCRENTCFASEECKSIKHIPGQEFHQKSINIVFIGSGFHNIDSWRHYVAKTFQAFDHFAFLNFGNPRYNAFYVDVVDKVGFCHFDCEGYPTLLCCDVKKSRAYANKCFPTGSHLHMVVVHNSNQYGGAGYRYQNLATTSIHPSGPLVAVHELGHSLFELGDEYVATQFTDRSAANCDVKGCPKWNDLSQHLGIDLCHVTGCKNGNFYVGANSFMRELNQPMGHVNLRYTCCTYLALTKGVPEYCKQYDFGNGGLLGYCQRDYQGYGGAHLYSEDGRNLKDDSSKGKFIVVVNPVRLTIDLDEQTFSYADSHIFEEGPQLIITREYLGDFYDIMAVCNSDVSNVIEVALEFDTGEIKKLYFNDMDGVDAPPTISSPKEDVNVFVQSVLLDIVVDASKGVVIDVDITELEITLWFRIRTWLFDLLSNLFGWLFQIKSDSAMQTK